MELDDAYDNLGHIPGGAEFPPRWDSDAKSYRAAFRASGRLKEHLSYGASGRARYDLFLPRSDPAGLAIFVHGGYWRRFDHRVWSHFSAGPVARGWAVAIPSYDLCPTVRISDITRQIAAMITKSAGDTDGPIVLFGHSAGGHLVARMTAPGLLPETVARRIGRITPISPVADLRPLMRTSMNVDFRLTEDEARAESPVLTSDRLASQVHVWVGADERPAFLEQARWLSDAWQCPLRIAPGRHHLNVIDDLADPQSALTSDILG
ncbi:MAG: alpha/beta hydrolase [Pseudomonadota bacterium]